VLRRKVGDSVKAGESLCSVHYNSEDRGLRAREMIRKSYQVADKAAKEKRKLVHRVIRGSGGK
jgi:thymidine phosphorylase